MRAVDDGNRRAPITLTTDTPVANAELDLLFSQALCLQSFSDLLNTLRDSQTVKLPGIYKCCFIALVAIPVLPLSRGIFVTRQADYLDNG